jgi:hypothetical protein
MIEIFVTDASSLIGPDQDLSNMELLLIIEGSNNGDNKYVYVRARN